MKEFGVLRKKPYIVGHHIYDEYPDSIKMEENGVRITYCGVCEEGDENREHFIRCDCCAYRALFLERGRNMPTPARKFRNSWLCCRCIAKHLPKNVVARVVPDDSTLPKLRRMTKKRSEIASMCLRLYVFAFVKC